MGGSVSSGTSNDELIDNLVEASFLQTPELQRAFRAVDRGNYCLPNARNNAYKDLAWKRGNLHLSAPCVYSVVLENLQLKPGLSFLNIGSGTGYLSTIAGLLLGAYGVNHGIELHSDVVNFAYDRLENFLKLSAAVDLYDFCEPTFSVGNALTPHTFSHQYDRVYCSAKCSDEYELYIKNLVKDGGILIMALEGKLVKLVKNKEGTWESEKILSSNFEPLESLPASKEPLIYVKLGEYSTPKLQNICRSRIRSILRDAIHKEHPDIEIELNKRDKHPKRQAEQIFIPFYDNINPRASTSAARAEESTSQEHTVESRLPRRMTIFLEDFLRRHAEVQLLRDIHDQFSAEEEPLPPLEQTTPNQDNVQPAGSEPTSQNEESKVEQSPGDEALDSSKPPPDQTTSSQDNVKPTGSELTSRNEISKVEQSPADEALEPSKSSSQSTHSHEKHNLKRKRSGEDDPTTSSEPSTSYEPASESPKRMKSSSAALVTKKLDDVKADQANADPHVSGNENISDWMAEKIGKLSLPKLVQRYVNYNRDNYFLCVNWLEFLNVQQQH